MSQDKEKALRRRIVPSVPLTLELEDDSGSRFTRVLRLSFDFNAIAIIEELTGYSLLRGQLWAHLSAKTLGIMLWAAALAHHPEYEGEEGLVVVRSFIDAGNCDQVTIGILDAYIASLPKSQQGYLLELREKALKGGSEDPTQEPGAAAPSK